MGTRVGWEERWDMRRPCRQGLRLEFLRSDLALQRQPAGMATMHSDPEAAPHIRERGAAQWGRAGGIFVMLGKAFCFFDSEPPYL